MLSSQNLLYPVQRRADRRADAGHGARLLLPDRRSSRTAQGAFGAERPAARRGIYSNFDEAEDWPHATGQRSSLARADRASRDAEAPAARLIETTRRPHHLQRGPARRSSASATSTAWTRRPSRSWSSRVQPQAARQRGHRRDRRQDQERRLRLRDAVRHHDRRERPARARREGRAARGGRRADRRDRRAVRDGPDHRRGALRRRRSTIWSRHHGRGAEDDPEPPGPIRLASTSMAISGAKGNIRQITPDGRHARSDDRPVGPHHRPADPLELPRRSDGAGVLHLDARRAQGSRRHGAPHGGLRLPDPPSDRRGAGRDHRSRTTAARRTGIWLGEPSEKGLLRVARRAHHRPLLGRGPRATRRPARSSSSATRRSTTTWPTRIDALRASTRSTCARALTCQAKRGICALCYGRRPRARPLVDARRGRRHHRRAVDRRAGHAADDAHVPHRWCGRAGHHVAVFPRVEELFEARVPKGQALIAEIDGIAEIDPRRRPRARSASPASRLYRDEYEVPKGAKLLVKKDDVEQGRSSRGCRSCGRQGRRGREAPQEGEVRQEEGRGCAEILEGDVIARIGRPGRRSKARTASRSCTRSAKSASTPMPAAARLRVENGDYVHAGQQLTEGSLNPQDILRIQGPEAVQLYLVEEVQKVYRSQGVTINDKHIEVIVRQMLRKRARRRAGRHRRCCRASSSTASSSRRSTPACWPRAASRRRRSRCCSA